MDQNSSNEELIINIDPMVIRIRMSIVQVLVWFFMFINIFMLSTFFSRQDFRGTARYILFAHTLLLDSIYLLLTDLLVLLHSQHALIPVSSCIVICSILEIARSCTPLTINAMCLERYVAICMPLRHATISTAGRTLAVIAVISARSSLNPFMDIFILIFTSPPGYFAKPTLCEYEIMILTEWHHFIWFVRYQMEFVVIVIITLFCYVKIMLAARNASGENKHSVAKGSRTLLLHGLQIFLCMVDMFCPYWDTLARERNLQLYLTIRYFNFVALGIISRALSSIIYGLRDKKFLLALMSCTTCRVNRNIGN